MKSSGSVDSWRNYFFTAKGDIFDIIDHAITVAAIDCPQEFKLRRDRIAEKLFTCKLTRCSGCDKMELAVPAGDDNDDDIGIAMGSERDGSGGGTARTGSKESKVNSSRGDDDRDHDHHKLHYDNVINNNHNNQIVSNYSYGEAEALTDEIEEESLIVGEVLRIKSILSNSQYESDSVLIESLRKLELMNLSVDTLEATGIGRAVTGVSRKHGSKQIKNLAKSLIDCWKEMVDEWVSATKGVTVVERTPDSIDPSVVDEEEGLPSPPMDEGAFFSTNAGIELSQFFDGMDDFGNPRNCGEFAKNRENGRRASLDDQYHPKQKPQTPSDTNMLAKESKGQQVKPNKPSNANTGPVRPPRQNPVQNVNNESKLQQRADKTSLQKKSSSTPEKFKAADEAATLGKFEEAKRKLHERYQEAEKAKRQRTIQVMDLHDLPKQGHGNRNQHMRPGNHNRSWAKGRR